MRLETAAVVTALVVTTPCFAKGGSGPSPNDQRSNAMNPNNDAYKASVDNRANQLNPEHPAYWSSRGVGEDDFGSSPPLGNSVTSSRGSSNPAYEPDPGFGGRLAAPRATTPARPSNVGVRIFSWLGGSALALYLAMAAFVRSRRGH